MKDINLETQENLIWIKFTKVQSLYMKLKWLLKKFHNQTFITENTSSGMKYGFNNQDVGFSFCMGFYQPEDWGVWSSNIDTSNFK